MGQVGKVNRGWSAGLDQKEAQVAFRSNEGALRRFMVRHTSEAFRSRSDGDPLVMIMWCMVYAWNLQALDLQDNC